MAEHPNVPANTCQMESDTNESNVDGASGDPTVAILVPSPATDPTIEGSCVIVDGTAATPTMNLVPPVGVQQPEGDDSSPLISIS